MELMKLLFLYFFPVQQPTPAGRSPSGYLWLRLNMLSSAQPSAFEMDLAVDCDVMVVLSLLTPPEHVWKSFRAAAAFSHPTGRRNTVF